jgi:DNA (cytosine-5)-methyltransferase 1
MRFISLFAGIGGIDLGLERAGWRCVAQVEIDPYCRAVLAKHWPDVPRFGDISGVSVRDLPATDALVGGFPCQPVSVAGSRKGHADERWLWPEFYRLVREVRPRWVVAENVPGLRTLGADGVIQDLESCGYAVWPLVVGADDVGAPHRRKRVFVVAHRDGEGLEGRRVGPGSSGSEQPLPPGGGVPRWPSRPGEPQYEWEPPRLVYSTSSRRNARRFGEGGALRDETRGPESERRGRDGCPEPGLGILPDGLPRGLAPRDRRARLKALGNAVVSQCAEAIGKAILALDYSKTRV